MQDVSLTLVLSLKTIIYLVRCVILTSGRITMRVNHEHTVGEGNRALGTERGRFR